MSIRMLYADINDAVKDERRKESPAFTKEQGKQLIEWVASIIIAFSKRGENFISAEFVDVQNGVTIITSGGVYYSPELIVPKYAER